MFGVGLTELVIVLIIGAMLVIPAVVVVVALVLSKPRNPSMAQRPGRAPAEPGESAARAGRPALTSPRRRPLPRARRGRGWSARHATTRGRRTGRSRVAA
jgi:hypothetical protein